MGTIKDRNGVDLIEAEVLRKCGKNTQKTVQKRLSDPDNHDGMITHLELSRHPGMRSQVGLRKHHYEQS